MISYRTLIILFTLFISLQLKAQKSDSFKAELDSIAQYIPALNQKVDFTVNEIPLSDFIRGVANEAGLNVSLGIGLNQIVSNNFSNVQIKDLIYFIKKNYNVEVEIIGNILNIRNIPVPPPARVIPVIVKFDKEKELITVEANNAPIEEFTKEITKATGVNLVVTPNARSKQINAYIKELPIKSALQELAVANGIKASKSEEGFYIIDAVQNNAGAPNRSSSRNNSQYGARANAHGGENQPSYLKVKVHHKDSIDVLAGNAKVNELIKELFTPLNISYHLVGEVSETISMETKGESLQQILDDLFVGLTVAIRKVNDTYWIGSRDVIEMKEVKIVSMRYRSIDSLQYIIPENLKTDVEIIDYPDQNSLIIAGSNDRVRSLSGFLKSVDKLIPVVLIEVMIIDNNNSKALSTGISAGLADEPVATSGTILPSADLTLGSGSINKLIDGLNGFGWVNLGQVKPNFYMTLKALDENGYVDIKSTPQLATMNGHNASMSIGRTEYYKEELNTMYGTVTSSSQTTTTYKPVEAELKMKIKPIISGNQDITLQITVEQSDFTERIEKNAPPGKVSRKFESLIRIKDQEMILLGGLEEAEKRDTRSGFPLLSRIPGLSWLFSSKTKAKSESKLNIFIKPTIIN